MRPAGAMIARVMRPRFTKASLAAPLGASAALLAACLLMAAPARAKTSWQLVYSEPNNGNAIFDVTAVDGQTGWAVGFSQQGGSASPLGLRTSDGVTWTMMPLPPSTTFLTLYTQLGFVDAQRGWLGGVAISIAGEQPMLWQSDNGGLSWTETAQPSATLEQLQAVASGELFAVGGTVLLRSLDGTGAEEIGLPVAADAAATGIHMLNPTCGYALAANEAGFSTVLWTADSGTSWEIRAEALPITLRRAWFVSADLGWAAGEQAGRGLVARTSDGGRTWVDVSLPDHPPLIGNQPAPVTECRDVRFFDDLRGVALCLVCTAECDVPDGSPSYLTMFARSEDGGQSWQMDPDYEPQMNAPPFGELMKASGMFAMVFPDPNNGFIAGQNNLLLRYGADSPEPPGWGPASCEPGGGAGNSTGGHAGSGGSTGASGGDDGGCGCRMVGRSAGGRAGVVSLLALLALARRRRR